MAIKIEKYEERIDGETVKSEYRIIKDSNSFYYSMLKLKDDEMLELFEKLKETLKK